MATSQRYALSLHDALPIYIGEDDAAAGVEMAAAVNGNVLGHRAVGMAGDGRGCAGADAGDVGGLWAGAAVAVGNRDVVLLGQRLADRHVLGGAVGPLEASA